MAESRIIEFDIQTIGAAQVHATSIDSPEGSCQKASLAFSCCDTSFSQGSCGLFEGVVLRQAGAASNPTRFGSLVYFVTNFTTPIPSVTFNVNTTEKTLDILLTGKAGVTINWHIVLTVTPHNP